jgi:signal transduction histidine kinase
VVASNAIVTGFSMRLSIRYQLLLPHLALLLIFIGMSTWTALASAERVRQQIDAQVDDILVTVQNSKFPLTEKVMHLMKGFSGADYFLVDSQHRWTTLPSSDVDLPREVPHTHDAGALSSGQRIKVGDKGYLCSGIRLQQGPNAGAELYVFYPESVWHDALWDAVRPSLILGAFGGMASVALTVGLGQRLSRRIRNLERRTRLIAGGDFSPMPLPSRNDELRDLSQSVNDMAARLSLFQETTRQTEQVRLLGQVAGGLAHQLRNGVTGARLAVQLHDRECSGRADGEALQVALRQLAMVEMHLKQFLSLGRTGELRLEICPLAAVLNDAIGLVTPQCRHAHIALDWQSPPGLIAVRADSGQLGQLFLNVLTNAIEAAGPDGRVEVRLSQPDSGDAVVEITDSGPGPTDQVAGRLFEPFVTGKPDGVGLGLAVARQIAEAHRGKIDWKRAAGGTCFYITLPGELRS